MLCARAPGTVAVAILRLVKFLEGFTSNEGDAHTEQASHNITNCEGFLGRVKGREADHTQMGCRDLVDRRHTLTLIFGDVLRLSRGCFETTVAQCRGP